MYIYNWIKKFKKRIKKGELPGWSVIVFLIIGLFLLFIIIYISLRSKHEMGKGLDFIKNLL
jgi:hypothetical protein